MPLCELLHAWTAAFEFHLRLWLHLSAARQVYGGQLKNGVLLGADVELPTLGDDFGDAADHDVAKLRVVASGKWSYRHQLVYTLHNSADC